MKHLVRAGVCGFSILLLNPGFAGTAAPAAVARPASVQIPRRDFFGNPTRTAAIVSPDGRHIAFLAPRNKVLNVWVAPVGAIGQASPVTDERTRPVQQFFWSPDSAQILLLKDEGGTENFRLFGMPLSGGAARSYTPFEKTQVSILRISPAIKDAILIGMNRRDPQWSDAWRLDLRSGKLSEVWRNPGGYASIFADGKLRPIVAQKSLPDGGGRIDRIESDGGTRALLEFGLVDAQTAILGTRDADTAFLVSSIGRDKSELVALDLRSGRLRSMARDAQGDVASIVQDPVTGDVDAYGVNYLKRSWTALNPAMARDIDFLDKAIDGQWTIDSRSDDGRWQTIWADAVSAPPAFYLFDRKTRALSKLFDTRPELAGRELAPMHAMEIAARDGLKLASYLTLPPGADPDGDGIPSSPLPLVVRVHGGPWTRDVFGYNGSHQWLANRGYAVLAVNFRGSTGFGKAFLNAGNLEWGRAMQTDLFDAVDEMVRRRVASADHVAVMGTSYGGYATLAALTMAPERFRCGIDVAGPSNLLTLFESIPPSLAALYSQFTQRMGDPETEAGRAMLAERSPLTHAAAIRVPLLIGHGANDPRVKQSEADQLVEELKRRKIPVSYILYPDEGHGFVRQPNRESFNAITEQFLGDCLGGAVEPIGSSFEGSSLKIVESGRLELPD